MTDEERALGIVNGAFLHTHEKWAMKMAIKRALSAVRTDEREKCAKLADQEAARQYAGGTQGAALAYRDAAAAIRAMGDKG